MSFFGEVGSSGDGGGVGAPGRVSSNGFPGFPPHLKPPMVFSQRYFGQGGRGNWHSLISEKRLY